MELIPLDPAIPADREYLAEAYDWIQERPWAFPHSGGRLSLDQFLQEAGNVLQKNVGVLSEAGRLVSLVTVIKEFDEYRLHLTSPRGADSEIAAAAARSVINSLFRELGARSAYTSSPIYRGWHQHRGSMRLCEACGGEFTGHIETDEFGNQWKRYEITRERWLNTYGRQNQEHLRQPADELLVQ